LPPAHGVRAVPLVDFENLGAAPHSINNDYPLTPGSSIVGPVFDCLTPMYRGAGEAPQVTEQQGWTRQLGTPRSSQGPDSELIRTAALELDLLFWSIRLASILVEWIVRWNAGAPVIATTYRLLPVHGTAGLDLQPHATLVQHLRVPAPYVRFTITNEEAATNIAADEVLFHVWLRGN
jgi:hypothetical protein